MAKAKKEKNAEESKEVLEAESTKNADNISETNKTDSKETTSENLEKKKDEKNQSEKNSKNEISNDSKEVKNEEVKTDQVKEEDREGFYNFSLIEEYTSDYDFLIEKNRLAFNKTIKVDRIIRYSVIVLALGLFFFSWLYIYQHLDNKPLGISLIAVAGVVMITYLFVTKGLTAKLSNNYLSSFYKNTSLKIFNDESKYCNLLCNPLSGFSKEDFEDNEAFKNISRTISKNEVLFIYNGEQPVRIADLAAFSIGADKYERPVFVGKYVALKNTYSQEKPIFIYLKGYKYALPPTGIDDVAKVYNSENLLIQTDNQDYKKNISDEFVVILDKYVCNNILLDGTIIIKKGVTYLCLGYSDEFGAIPFKSKYNPGPLKQYVEDLDKFISLNSSIK